MKTRGFTLLELLSAIAIIAILSALAFIAVRKVQKSGATAREVSAARQAIAAYIRAATDRDGELMVGYASKEGATDELGVPVMDPACGRYPWRLAPYFDYKLIGTLLVNEQEELAKIKSREEFVYRVSAHPSFGINATYVGGNQRTGVMPTTATINRYGDFVATRLNRVAYPGKLLVFASARFTDGTRAGQGAGVEKMSGFHIVYPPRTTKTDWSGKYDESEPAEKFGMLHLRHNGRAVCAFLGGNVEMLDGEQLQDMRYWSPQAAELNEQDFKLRLR